MTYLTNTTMRSWICSASRDHTLLATTVRPQLAVGALFPSSWLRWLVDFSTSGSENLSEIRIHSDVELNESFGLHDECELDVRAATRLTDAVQHIR